MTFHDNNNKKEKIRGTMSYLHNDSYAPVATPWGYHIPTDFFVVNLLLLLIKIKII